MIRIFILLLLTSPSIFAQQPKKQNPTIKESVAEIKRSGKAIGDLFKKKKNKETTDSVITPATNPELKDTTSRPTTFSMQDTLIKDDIVEKVNAHLINLHKTDKPGVQVMNNTDYCEIQFDFGDGIRSSSYFSKQKKDNVLGDLNGDGKEDLVLKIFSNSGGNTEYLDLLIFIHEEPTGLVFKQSHESSDPDLKGCEIGQFVPLYIEKGILIGRSSCFTDADPRCCPSLKYTTHVKWDKGKLNFIKKTKEL